MPVQESRGEDGRPRVHAEDRAQWHDWLARHHADSDGVWLVSWKAHTGRPRVSYPESVEEALVFGWVDSRSQRLDDDRTMLWFTPRKPSSGWSRPNKERIARLQEQGRLQPAGRRAVEVARANGAWERLDAVEDLIVPDDLAAALAAHPGARAHWDAFPRSARRALLEWIVQARRPQTRLDRVTRTAASAARGERANERPAR